MPFQNVFHENVDKRGIPDKIGPLFQVTRLVSPPNFLFGPFQSSVVAPKASSATSTPTTDFIFRDPR